MKKLVVRLMRQSPAMIVAMLALFVALTGTAVATTSALITGAQIKNNSITGADVKNKSLTSRDFRGSVRGPRGLRGLTGATGATGAKGDKGDTGSQGAAGPGARWAHVAANGTIREQSGGITIQHPLPGEYYLDFGSSQVGKVIQVTGSWLGNNWKFSFVAIRCGGTPPSEATCTDGVDTNHPDTIYVQPNATDGTGAAGNADFYVAVF